MNKPLELSDRITESWIKASEDLGFTFIAPFDLEDGGKTIRYIGLVPDFGRAKGMLIFTCEDLKIEPWASVAGRHGFGYSCLSEIYTSYQRAWFIDALNVWGWGPKDRNPPAWYRPRAHCA